MDNSFINENINTIINDDCFNVLDRIPDNSIDCIYVDVPYLIDNHGYGNSEMAKRMAKRDFNLYDIGEEKYNENLTISENMKQFNKRGKVQENVRINNNIKNSKKDRIDITKGFDYKTFIKQAFRIMKKPNMFIWCSKNQIRDIMNEINIYTKNEPNILVWCKTNPVPATNNVWLSDVEYCLYVRGGGH